jgi:NADH dehydrogenase
VELRRENISPMMLALAGSGDPARAPAELIAVLGEGPFLLPRAGWEWYDETAWSLSGQHTGLTEYFLESGALGRRAGEQYYGINPADIQAILVHSEGRALEREMPESLALYAQKILQQRGVEFLFHKRLTSATPDYAILDDGRKIPTRTLVSTVPSSPNPAVVALEVPKDHGRIKTDLHLRVEGCADLWALGDCALIPNSRGGGFCPPTAQ